jgi:hypothetical protein
MTGVAHGVSMTIRSRKDTVAAVVVDVVAAVVTGGQGGSGAVRCQEALCVCCLNDSLLIQHVESLPSTAARYLTYKRWHIVEPAAAGSAVAFKPGVHPHHQSIFELYPMLSVPFGVWCVILQG